MEIGTLFDKIMDYKFLAVGLAIVAVMYYFKKFVFKINPKFYEGKVFKTILSIVPLGLGVAAAIPKGILAGDTFTQRIIFGIVAAYFSEKVIYELLLKRLTSLGINLPEGIIPNKEDIDAIDNKVVEEDKPVEKEESDEEKVEPKEEVVEKEST